MWKEISKVLSIFLTVLTWTVCIIFSFQAFAMDEACLVAALPAIPTEIDASNGNVALCSNIFDRNDVIWPETGFPLICEIELDGQVVIITGEIGPGTAFEFIDLTMRDDHLAQAWCTSAHIEGRGDLLAPQPIPARFPPSTPAGPAAPGRPFFVSLPGPDSDPR